MKTSQNYLLELFLSARTKEKNKQQANMGRSGRQGGGQGGRS